jgi:tetratricopeptide (TPR) repeat protein
MPTPASGEDIALEYRRFVAVSVLPGSDQTAVDRQVRAAAVALFQAGLLRHKLLLLSETIDRFEERRAPQDPRCIFPEFLHQLGQDPPLAAVAERYYRLALVLSPDFVEAIYALAVLKQDHNPPEAVELFRLALHHAGMGHPAAQAHAHMVANAFWNLAGLYRRRGDDKAADAAYGQAFSRLQNYGVHHVALADFQRRRGKVDAAAIEYERIMPYSHLYAAEFVEPAYSPEERLPVDPAGQPLDPLAATAVETVAGAGTIVYWWHLYVLLPPKFGPPSSERLWPCVRPLALPQRTARSLAHRVRGWPADFRIVMPNGLAGLQTVQPK